MSLLGDLIAAELQEHGYIPKDGRAAKAQVASDKSKHALGHQKGDTGKEQKKVTATSAQTREVKAAPGSNISAPSQIQKRWEQPAQVTGSGNHAATEDHLAQGTKGQLGQQTGAVMPGSLAGKARKAAAKAGLENT
ncbi:hypothetical protein WJX84_009687 [Apatococcus fuscideae]|uniref:Uncharacterized protein n=1 Tax=Apatococcus fuscideae TaxID=2026836 RepID=A0AAW1TLQ0_9CHLO